MLNVKKDYRLLKLQHDELITNTNIGDQLAEYQDNYMLEIQNLTNLLAELKEENKNKVERLETEK